MCRTSFGPYDNGKSDLVFKLKADIKSLEEEIIFLKENNIKLEEEVRFLRDRVKTSRTELRDSIKTFLEQCEKIHDEESLL